jgi:hypothetical protein
MEIGRRELIKTLVASACLGPLGVTAWGATATPVDTYVQRIDRLMARHRNGVSRLRAPAEMTADALIAGGSLSLGGAERGWISEGSGRSGGIMHLVPASQAKAGDVVWLSYAADSYDAQLKAAADLEANKVLVIAFGPRPASGAPGFHNWIDSMTPWSSDQNFNLMGNVLSLWTLTGELAAATARKGKTMVFWQSIVMPILHHEFVGRNDRYQGRMFHEAGEPHMEPVKAGVAASAYLDSMSKTIRDLESQELQKIVGVGQEVGRRAAASHPAEYFAITHMVTGEVLGKSKWLTQFRGSDKDNAKLTAALGSDGYLVWMGYYNGVPAETWDAVRKASAKAAWIVVPLPGQSYDFDKYGDVFINQHWDPGDAVVTMPGYDVHILPAMGVTQLYILEIMRRAAGVKLS